MRKVLWISRHQMTPSQLSDLERIMGDGVELVPVRETVTDLQKLAGSLRQVDAVAAVLPTELLAQLVAMANKQGIPVIQAVSERRPSGKIVTLADGRQEPEMLFVHAGWQQIVKLELETRML